MNRLKVYRACLWGALMISVATLFFYCKWYLQTRVPDVIRVGTEEEVQVVDLGHLQTPAWLRVRHIVPCFATDQARFHRYMEYQYE